MFFVVILVLLVICFISIKKAIKLSKNKIIVNTNSSEEKITTSDSYITDGVEKNYEELIPPSTLCNGTSLSDAYDKAKKYWEIGESTKAGEKLEKALESFIFYYFVPTITLDFPTNVLQVVGKYITDINTLNFLNTFPSSGLIQTTGDRYEEVEAEMKRAQKDLKEFIKFREIIESKIPLQKQKEKINLQYKKNELLFNKLLNLHNDDNWTTFTNKGLNFSDYLIALSYFNYGNPKAFELYLNNYRTQNDYMELTIDILKNLNFKVSTTQEKILKFKTNFLKLADTRDIWLFNSNFKEWKEKNPLTKTETLNLKGVYTL